MLNIYTSNRLEHLFLMLQAVLKSQGLPVLATQSILVQNSGLKHWLMLELAKSQSVSMNVVFEPPGKAVWHVLRQIDPKLPRTHGYDANGLAWRIFNLLDTDKVKNDALFAEANDFWQTVNDEGVVQCSEQKRFQMANIVANLFEQYQIYRPDWLMNEDLKWGSEHDQWQAKLWQYLILEDGNHPLALMDKHKAVVSQPLKTPNHRNILFALNNLPPLWLDFFQNLAKHQDIHLFFLNPCNEFWHQIKSDKTKLNIALHDLEARLDKGKLPDSEALERLTQFELPEDPNDLWFDADNALLANLGQQGQAFLKSLYQYDNSRDFSAFIDHRVNDEPLTLLQQLQNDVLAMSNAPVSVENVEQDQSISIHACHSPLREVQQLHDWLLAQFDQNQYRPESEQLHPNDVLVMCPQVEDYAAFIEAVFAKKGVKKGASSTEISLPFSLADRSKHSDMLLIRLFLELLALPDQRFNVSQIFDLLRTPLVANKFKFSSAELELISLWLNRAAIHWGLDGAHKAQFDLPNSESFTWQQGLQRLLKGFAFSDQETVVVLKSGEKQLLLPDVEGDNALVLGKLMQFMDYLSVWARQLSSAKTIDQWLSLFATLRENVFLTGREFDQQNQQLDKEMDAFKLIHQQVKQRLSLSVVKEYFTQRFNLPSQGEHFLTGQITFCSMVPMRSVPFKIICILGLNDGHFPRVQTRQNLDLISVSSPRLGDRSASLDDRYLFLETLICAREKLYLSYQGNQVKDNVERQPSRVLTELMQQLSLYGWQARFIQKATLQPFSPENYPSATIVNGENGTDRAQSKNSYHQGWLNLLQRQQPPADQQAFARIEDQLLAQLPSQLSLAHLVRFLDQPAKYFAQQHLGLYFDEHDDSLSDIENFQTNHLDRYQCQQDLLTAHLDDARDGTNTVAQVLEKARLSGKLPNTSKTDNELNEWRDYSDVFAQQLIAFGVEQVEPSFVSITFDNTELVSDCMMVHDVSQSQQLVYRLATVKAKDKVLMWLNHCLMNTVKPCKTVGVFRDKEANEATMNLEMQPLSVEQAKGYLQDWWAFYCRVFCQPHFINVTLAELVSKKGKRGKFKDKYTFDANKGFDSFWFDGEFSAPAQDEYCQYFWPMANIQYPELKPDDIVLLQSLFTPINAALEDE